MTFDRFRRPPGRQTNYIQSSTSGQHLNYSKLSSDSEINKETIRRYFDILQDTLIVERIPPYTDVPSARKARQKDRFVFFDLGVRNALLNRHKAQLSREEIGSLFEQFIILQCISYRYCFNPGWQIFTYLDAAGTEVDMILETDSTLVCVEVKSATKANRSMFRSLDSFSALVKKPVKKYVVYCGPEAQKFEQGLVLPYTQFLSQIVPKL